MTDQIIEKLSIEGIQHFTAGIENQVDADAEPFLQKLPALVRSFERCQVLLYQAGADPHVKDPLGGWMSTEQLARRDRIVFETAMDMGLPLAWNLAGGYQRDAEGGIAPVLEIHRNTMKECICVYVR